MTGKTASPIDIAYWALTGLGYGYTMEVDDDETIATLSNDSGEEHIISESEDGIKYEFTPGDAGFTMYLGHINDARGAAHLIFGALDSMSEDEYGTDSDDEFLDYDFDAVDLTDW